MGIFDAINSGYRTIWSAATIAQAEPQCGHLVEQGGSPHVGVLAQALAHIRHEEVGSSSPASPATRVPFRWLRIVSRLWPRCRAMAEFDQPCSRNAVVSMSSFPLSRERESRSSDAEVAS